MLYKSLILTTLLTQILATSSSEGSTDVNRGMSLKKRHFDYDDDYQCSPEPDCRIGWLPTRSYSDYCREGEGYCARDGGYYICQDGSYCKKYCGCKGTSCVEDYDSFSCKYGNDPNPGVCGPEPNLVLAEYIYGGKPGRGNCRVGTGFCADDGGYYTCVENWGFEKFDCGCPNTRCMGFGGKLACVSGGYASNNGGGQTYRNQS